MHPVRPPRALALIALLIVLTVLGACGKHPPAAANDPVGAVATLVGNLRDNDLQRFYAQSLPPELRERTTAAYNARRAALPPADAKDREEFARTMDKLTAPGAEDALYAELEPALVKHEAEIVSQLPLTVAMGSGFVGAAIAESNTLSADAKQHASTVLAAVAGWASNAPIANRDKARAVIAVATASARAMQIHDLDTLRKLDLDAALAKGGLLWAGLKRIAVLYGLDLDAALDSVKAEALSRDGDSARVKVRYTLLGKPVEFEMAMVQRDGRWYSGNAIARAEAALQVPAAVAGATDAAAGATESAPAPAGAEAAPTTPGSDPPGH